MGSNPYGRKSAWRFFRKNFGKITARYKDSAMLLGQMIEGIISSFASENEAQEIESFFAARPLPEVSRRIEQSIEHIRTRARWIERDGKEIESWLLKWKQKQSSGS